MKKDRYKRYLQDQMREALKYKWTESEKAGKDLGEAAILDWISKYAKRFRRYWEKQDLEEVRKGLKELHKKSDADRKIFMEYMECLIDEVEEMLEE